jgi:glyoxylase-like metal-dependent hydrolase (beta-lactamase superfamily II)
MLVFRQLFDAQSSTDTYLLADDETRECVLTDPVFEQASRDSSFIQELGMKLLWTLETHVHADHVTGAWLLKQKLGSRIGLAAATEVEGDDSGGSRPSFRNEAAHPFRDYSAHRSDLMSPTVPG